MAQNEERLIDAGPLESQLENLAKSWTGTFSGPAYSNALERVKNAPTVDAVQVVRCGECIHQKTIDGYYACCKFMDSPVRVITSPRNYCSSGRRREAATNGRE